MSAKDNLNPDQLRMFMRPGEIMNMVTDSGDRSKPKNWGPNKHAGRETMDEMWERKRWESDHHPMWLELPGNIQKEGGVRNPVKVEVGGSQDGITHDYTMYDGHHRVVIADQLEKETGKHYYLPVTYHSAEQSKPSEDYDDA